MEAHLLPLRIRADLTPSVKSGISAECEKKHKIFGCELIQEGSILLRLPQVVAVTGQCILNRFFYRKGLDRFDVFSIAMAAVLLASKVEEQFKTLREILFAFHHIYLKRKDLKIKPLELGGEQYTLWKNELITNERFILKELGFTLYSIKDHPHKYILYFVKLLNGDSELAQLCWNYLNDSMRLDLTLRFKAQTIACSSIFLASRKLGYPLPEDPPFWNILGDETNTIHEICSEILSLYKLPQTRWLEPLASVKYLSKEFCDQFDEQKDEIRDNNIENPSEISVTQEGASENNASATPQLIDMTTENDSVQEGAEAPERRKEERRERKRHRDHSEDRSSRRREHGRRSRDRRDRDKRSRRSSRSRSPYERRDHRGDKQERDEKRRQRRRSDSRR